MKSPIAVGFDFDHTLGNDHHLEVVAFQRLAAQFDIALDIEDRRLHDTIEAILVPFRADKIPMPGDDRALRRDRSARTRSCSRSDAAELAGRYRQICYDLVPKLVEPLPGAHECIAQLVADGIPVGILTNGWSALQERKIEHALGQFPGPLLVSDVIGAYKPSLHAFRELETALFAERSGLWYVGDNPVVDIAGARAYGLRAVWLNQSGHAYPAGLERRPRRSIVWRRCRPSFEVREALWRR